MGNSHRYLDKLRHRLAGSAVTPVHVVPVLSQETAPHLEAHEHWLKTNERTFILLRKGGSSTTRWDASWFQMFNDFPSLMNCGFGFTKRGALRALRRNPPLSTSAVAKLIKEDLKWPLSAEVTAIFPCPACEGTRVNLALGDLCPRCNGTGSVAQAVSGQEIPNPFCKP